MFSFLSYPAIVSACAQAAELITKTLIVNMFIPFLVSLAQDLTAKYCC